MTSLTSFLSSFRADCERCVGLCCMALPFAARDGFPEDKTAGRPCGLLSVDHRCTVHDRLGDLGYRGCVTFDCFGAGQQVTQVVFGGADWRTAPRLRDAMAACLPIVRGLHEMRFLLADPACSASSYAERARALDVELAALAAGEPTEVLAVDLPGLRRCAGELFAAVSAERRRPTGSPSHRGALLMASNHRGRDFGTADLLGADLRDADLRGADLSRALFLTQPQINVARGDATTRLPARLEVPGGWR